MLPVHTARNQHPFAVSDNGFRSQLIVQRRFILRQGNPAVGVGRGEKSAGGAVNKGVHQPGGHIYHGINGLPIDRRRSWTDTTEITGIGSDAVFFPGGSNLNTSLASTV